MRRRSHSELECHLRASRARHSAQMCNTDRRVPIGLSAEQRRSPQSTHIFRHRYRRCRRESAIVVFGVFRAHVF